MQKLRNNIQCFICKLLLTPHDSDLGATECLECEVGVCRPCVAELSQKGLPCRCCQSFEGFRKKLSKIRVEELENLKFTCNNFEKCGYQNLKFYDAENHI